LQWKPLPSFFSRIPHGYSDPKVIKDDLQAAGFAAVQLDTVELASLPMGARDAATGLCEGTPLRSEIEARNGAMLGVATDAAAAALGRIEHDGVLQSCLSGHVFLASK
jgi:hypothetical protein